MEKKDLIESLQIVNVINIIMSVISFIAICVFNSTLDNVDYGDTSVVQHAINMEKLINGYFSFEIIVGIVLTVFVLVKTSGKKELVSKKAITFCAFGAASVVACAMLRMVVGTLCIGFALYSFKLLSAEQADDDFEEEMQRNDAMGMNCNQPEMNDTQSTGDYNNTFGM
ncbi:MAG: hypothetical protein II838_08120 [Lachnospiraceae bacterium]|nr:hypothetical protein [Lachnospiraceae bacterium]